MVGSNLNVLRASAAVGALLIFGGPVAAYGQNATFSFNIPPADISSALRDFGRISGQQIAFDGAALQGRRSAEVRGAYTAEQGLTQLLAGTELVVKRSGNGVLLVSEARSVVAQPPRLAASSPVNVDELVVTGSRVIVNGAQAPTPVTVVSGQQLQNLRPGGLVTEALRQLPLLQNSPTPQAQGISTSNADNSTSTLNARNLGTTRTLVLLNGRRVVPATTAGTPDVSTFPTALLQRVDIVTGGASAAYGSDAVTAVVNYIIDTKFKGLKAEVTGGISDRNDNGHFTASVAGGADFAGGRGHVVASAERFYLDGIESNLGRDWLLSRRMTVRNPNVTATNPASAANPTFLTYEGVNLRNSTYGGLIIGGPLANIQFLPGGVPAPFALGTQITGGALQIGGDGAPDNSKAQNQPVSPPTERTAIFTHATYDITPKLQAFGELAFGETYSDIVSPPAENRGTSTLTIFRENAFLPASIRQQMVALNLASFQLGRFSKDVSEDQDVIHLHVRNINKRGMIGLRGEALDRWKWEASYSYGQNVYKHLVTNNIIHVNWFNAVDSVVSPTTGQPICRSSLQFPNNGCVPVNVFGEGSVTPAAAAYVADSTYRRSVAEQHFFDASVRGDLFQLPAGPLAVAAGVTHRKESVDVKVDAISSSIRSSTGLGFRGFPVGFEGALGGFERTNPQPMSGSYSVSEVFAELQAPLLRDRPFVRSLELNAAGRYAYYDLNVGGVWLYKLGAVYEPVESLRLRGTFSRDIRNANIQELFSPGQDSTISRADPFNGGATVTVVGQTVGNASLKPERSDTMTFGAVAQPSFLPRLYLSADYYSINIKDAIGSLGANAIVDQCFTKVSPDLCQFLRFAPNGSLAGITNPTLNSARRKTQGLDLEAAYNLNLAEVSPIPGDLGFRYVMTYVYNDTTRQKGGTPVEAIDFPGNPQWTGLLTTTYSHGPLAISVNNRIIPATSASRLAGGTTRPTTMDQDITKVKGVVYTSVSARYKFGRDDRYEISGHVNNLFDVDPPYVPFSSSFFAPLYTSLFYDRVGRAFTLSLKYRI